MQKQLLLLSLLVGHILSSAQNVGIGVTTPTSPLQINTRTSATRSNILLVDSTNNRSGQIKFRNVSNTASILLYGYSENNFFRGQYIDVSNDSVVVATFKGNGYVGISTVAPEYNLDVFGDINTTGAFRANGNAGTAGQVLKKSSTNTLAWEAPTIGFSANGTAPAVSNFQTVPPNVETQITILNNENADLNNLYNPITNEVLIPSNGFYHIDINIHINNADAGLYSLSFERASGSGPYQTTRVCSEQITSTNTDKILSMSFDYPLFANERLRLTLNHTAALSQRVTGSFFSWWNMHKLY